MRVLTHVVYSTGLTHFPTEGLRAESRISKIEIHGQSFLRPSHGRTLFTMNSLLPTSHPVEHSIIALAL